MRRFIPILLLILLALSLSVALGCYFLFLPMRAILPEEAKMWEVEKLPLNFWSSDVMPDGTTIIATERETARVYKSVDEGKTWEFIFQIPTNLRNRACLTFCDSRGNIFVSYPAEPPETAGLWRSGDGGKTFTRVWQHSTRPEANVRFKGITEDENGTLYFGTSVGPGGPCDIYRSVDGGKTWARISSIPGGKHIHALQYNPYNGWFYAVVGDPGYGANGLWRSKDGCLTWEKFTNLGTDPYTGKDWDIMSVGFYKDYVYLAIHWSRGQVLRLRDSDNLAAPVEEVFRSNLQLQNWVQLYQWGGRFFMLTGGERSLSARYPVGVWASGSPPFDAGTWFEVYLDGANTGSRGTACVSHKVSKNGWIFIANSFEGRGLRIRYRGPQSPQPSHAPPQLTSNVYVQLPSQAPIYPHGKVPKATHSR